MKINESIVLKEIQINNHVLFTNEKGLMARFRTKNQKFNKNDLYYHYNYYY